MNFLGIRVVTIDDDGVKRRKKLLPFPSAKIKTSDRFDALRNDAAMDAEKSSNPDQAKKIIDEDSFSTSDDYICTRVQETPTRPGKRLNGFPQAPSTQERKRKFNTIH